MFSLLITKTSLGLRIYVWGNTYFILIVSWVICTSFCLNCNSDLTHQGWAIRLLLAQIMGCHLFSTKPLSEPMLDYCQLDHKEHVTSIKFYLKIKHLFIHKNTFENIACKMAPMLSWPQCVNCCRRIDCTLGPKQSVSWSYCICKFIHGSAIWH